MANNFAKKIFSTLITFFNQRKSDNLLREPGNLPCSSINPAWISLIEGIVLTSPRAATLGGDLSNRRATFFISSFDISSTNEY